MAASTRPLAPSQLGDVGAVGDGLAAGADDLVDDGLGQRRIGPGAVDLGRRGR